MSDVERARHEDRAVREHVGNLLQGRGAHVPFERAVDGVPETAYGQLPAGAAHSLWQVLEHLRIAQWDILEFTRNPDHQSPEFPAGYWPVELQPDGAKHWQQSVDRFLAERGEMERLVGDLQIDLFTPLPHGSGQTVLREALVMADHNAYHVGELVVMRRLLGCW